MVKPLPLALDSWALHVAPVSHAQQHTVSLQYAKPLACPVGEVSLAVSPFDQQKLIYSLTQPGVCMGLHVMHTPSMLHAHSATQDVLTNAVNHQGF